jgi:hypothetical protein
MGIFQKFTKVFNRAPVELFVMFDGQQETIPPGEGDLPDLTVVFAKNQNPIMGSGDPHNPTVGGCQYLVVEEGDEGYGVPLTKEEWEAHLGRPCRFDEEAAFAEKYADDPKARLVKRGSGKSTARSRYEAATAASAAVFTGKD